MTCLEEVCSVEHLLTICLVTQPHRNSSDSGHCVQYRRQASTSHALGKTVRKIIKDVRDGKHLK